jgi:hypothetical protein
MKKFLIGKLKVLRDFLIIATIFTIMTLIAAAVSMSMSFVMKNSIAAFM